MKVPYYKGKKRAKRFSLKKSGSSKILRFGIWKFWMIQKSKKNFLLQITQNGPIRENKWLKPKSGAFFWEKSGSFKILQKTVF